MVREEESMTDAQCALLLFCARRLLLLWVGNKGSKDELTELIKDVEEEKND